MSGNALIDDILTDAPDAVANDPTDQHDHQGPINDCCGVVTDPSANEHGSSKSHQAKTGCNYLRNNG